MNRKKTKNGRMVGFTTFVIAFMIVVAVAMIWSVLSFEQDIVKCYQDDQRLIVEQLRDTIEVLYSTGSTDDEVSTYLDTLGGSGSRFYTLTKNQQVMFARDKVTTNGLGSLTEKEKFDKRIAQQDVEIVTASFTIANDEYELAVIYDRYYAKSNAKITRHSYYILGLLAITCLVMLALLEMMLGMWNKTEKNLLGTRQMLDQRNNDVKDLSEELMAGEGDKSDIAGSEAGTGITAFEETEIYNVYTMRDLIVKSKDRQMGEVHMLYIRFLFNDRYVSKPEMFRNIHTLQGYLKPNEVFGEIRKGVFVVFVYKLTKEQAKNRFEELIRVCNQTAEDMNLSSDYCIEYDDGRDMIEIFDSYREVE